MNFIVKISILNFWQIDLINTVKVELHIFFIFLLLLLKASLAAAAKTNGGAPFVWFVLLGQFFGLAFYLMFSLGSLICCLILVLCIMYVCPRAAAPGRYC